MIQGMRLCLLLLITFAARILSAAEWRPDTIPRGTPPKDEPAWLRCFIRVQDNMTIPEEKDLWRDSVTLSFAEIPEPFSVLLNGQKIIESPAIGESPRRFKVPKGILEKGAFNSVVVAFKKDASIGRAPVLAGYFDEVIL